MSHILLVEPNPLLAKIYHQALEQDNHTVTHVLSAQAAITAIDVQVPDIVVLELSLPQHSGVEFLHEFRSYIEWRSIPVIVHTSLTPVTIGEGRGVLAQDLGVRDILYKPQTSLQDLLRSIRECMARL